MSPHSPEKGILGEKAALETSQTNCCRYRMVNKMPSARQFFLTLFLGLLVTAGLANALLKQQPSSEDSAESENDNIVQHDDSTFSRLLSSASPQALHQFLHAYFPATYKHGIYDSDHSAMEAVHANDPELATSIVQMAKRQSGNETSSVGTTTATSVETSVVTPTSESSSTSQASSTQETSSTSQASSSDTTTSTATSTSTSTSAAEADTTTTISTTESTQGTTTPSSTLATSTASSSTPLTTSSKTSTFTSTLPGGAKTTITSVQVVTPGSPEEASTTASSSGSLQSGVAMPLAAKPVVKVVIGVFVGGALLV
ncbi:hypothetical protein F4804DRAFT_266888 [Jackrogersella minutella]|nr:hypothetical protein F4804DRAFT_266888 [Jackrogersella minutella]